MMSTSFWDKWLGRIATRRLTRLILPGIRRNQEIWGETILANAGHGVRWLDAGCGWRMLDDGLEKLENRLASSPDLLVGVDLDFPHLRKHLNISRRVGAAIDALPFELASFDLITCNMVVEHLADPLPVFKELARVLAPGGRLMIHTPNTRNYLVIASMAAKKVLPRSVTRRLINDGRAADDIFPTYYRANTVSALRELGQSVDFDVERARILTHPNPYTRFFAPLALLELFIMRATLSRTFEQFGTTIMMTFRKRPNHWGIVAPNAAILKEAREASAPM
jgi:SAM-dependent methyltransferase